MDFVEIAMIWKESIDHPPGLHRRAGIVDASDHIAHHGWVDQQAENYKNKTKYNNDASHSLFCMLLLINFLKYFIEIFNYFKNKILFEN